MAVFDVAEMTAQGREVTFVFLNSDASYLHDGARRQLLDMLQASATRCGYAGEVIPIWEFEGKTRFMAPLEYHEFLVNCTVADMEQHITGSIDCG